MALPAGPVSRGQQQIHARAAADVKNRLAGADGSDGVRISDAGE